MKRDPIHQKLIDAVNLPNHLPDDWSIELYLTKNESGLILNDEMIDEHHVDHDYGESAIVAMCDYANDAIAEARGVK